MGTSCSTGPATGSAGVTEREPRGDNRASPAGDLAARYHNYLRRNVPRAVLRSAGMAPVQRFAELAGHMR